MLLNKIGFLNVIIILNLCYPRKHCMLMINGTHRMFNDTVKPQLKAGKDINDEKDFLGLLFRLLSHSHRMACCS